MIRQRSLLAAALVNAIATALLVSACGGSDQPAATSSPTPSATSSTTPTPTAPALAALPARTIVKRAQAAMEAAESFRAKGAIVSDGQSISLNLGYGTTGTSGSMSSGGASIALIVIGKTLYFKPSEAFWRQQAPSKRQADAVIELVRGKWIKAPATDREFGSFAQLADKQGFVAGLFEDSKPKLKKTGPKSIDGIQCIGIDDGEGILWVDASNARPVRADAPAGSKDRGALRFTEYNAVTEPKAPPAELVIDSKKLNS